LQSAINKLEAERAELEAVLASGVLGRSNNLVRLLTFVCEKYFEGTIDEVKEYSIAVQALGRADDFDPQVDTIVRVTAHALRKRLEDYYRTSGAGHPVRICLPPGHYAPKFIHLGDPDSAAHVEPHESPARRYPDNGPHLENGLPQSQESSRVSPLPVQAGNGGQVTEVGRTIKFPAAKLWTLAAVVVAACFVAAFFWYRSSRTDEHEGRTQIQTNSVPPALSGKALRALAGNERAPYVDRSGFTWEKDRFCNGGSSFSVTGHAIQGTEDAQLFTNGRRGAFRCSYPVSPGTYEVHLLFAETSGILENSRSVNFSINGGPNINLDVVDDAGGNDIAITKVFLDVTPASDGMIHLDFNSPESVLRSACCRSESLLVLLCMAIPAGMSGCRTATFLADGSPALAVIYPRSLMAACTTGIALDTSIMLCR
jgi:malectin (di-glucose binding ER protein)